MSKFTYAVVVTTENKDQADYVMMSRINYDDDYGFDYQVEIDENIIDVGSLIERFGIKDGSS